MSRICPPHRPERQHDVLRWMASALAISVLHAGVAAALLWSVPPFEPTPAAPEAVLLDLPPKPEAAAEPPAPEPAPPPTPKPSPPDPPPPPIVPDAAVVLPQLAPGTAIAAPPPPVAKAPAPRLVLRPPTTQARPVQPAPSPPGQPNPLPPAPASPAVSSSAAPAAAPPPAVNANAPANWRGELIARLQRSKRYPDAARSRGDQGVAFVTFTMDRSGHILAATLVRSSGTAALDDEALSMLRRAEPLPALPAEMPAASITLTMPVSFTLH